MLENQKPSEMADQVVGNIQKDFKIVGTSRVHSWYAWAIVGIVFGMALGIIYVANRSGTFAASQAAEESAPEYTCPSEQTVKADAIAIAFPLPYSGVAKSSAISSNDLRKILADVVKFNQAIAANKPTPKLNAKTEEFGALFVANQAAASDLCEAKIDAARAAAGSCMAGCREGKVSVPSDYECTLRSELASGDSAPFDAMEIITAGSPGVPVPVILSGNYILYTYATAPALTTTIKCATLPVLNEKGSYTPNNPLKLDAGKAEESLVKPNESPMEKDGLKEPEIVVPELNIGEN